MLRTIQQRNTMVKIVMGVVLTLISVAMVITLVPGLTGSVSTNPDAVATVGSTAISARDVQEMLRQQTRGQNVPKILQGFYAKQILDQMIFKQALEIEAQYLGLQVTPEEAQDRIRVLLPSVFSGDNWVGNDRYALEVEQHTGMSVPQFEDWIRESLLQEKFRQLVTDGLSVSPTEIQQEFRRRNEKVKIDYVLLRPADLASSINPSDSELGAYFAKNKGRYSIPEKRSARYALLDFNQLRNRVKISEADIRDYYAAHLEEYKVQSRAHVEHILFKTVGKTDAEVAEIRKKAEDVLRQAKHGANFEDLARKYSDDTSKDKGGDLGWILLGQTVPEFEKVAFSLPKGEVSDLVKTQYGFHIIKVLDRENARTKSLEEVRLSIIQTLSDQRAEDLANQVSSDLARAVRESNRQKLDDLAKKFNLQVGEAAPASVSDAVDNLGSSPEIHNLLFELRPGELSQPIRLEKGYAILTLKDVIPAHPATLAEARDRVLADYRKEKSIALARSKAAELSQKVKSGQTLSQAAKSMGLPVKSSDSFARNGSVPDLGSAQKLDAAFTIAAGQTSTPVSVDANWVVFTVISHDQPNPADFAKQQHDIEQSLLDGKRAAAFDAFRTALEERLTREGKLIINREAVKRLIGPAA